MSRKTERWLYEFLYAQMYGHSRTKDQELLDSEALLSKVRAQFGDVQVNGETTYVKAIYMTENESKAEGWHKIDLDAVINATDEINDSVGYTVRRAIESQINSIAEDIADVEIKKSPLPIEEKVPMIVPAPAGKLHGLLALVFPTKVYENTLEQMKGDFREEYYDLLKQSGGKVVLRHRWLTFLHTINCLCCVARLVFGKIFMIPAVFRGAGK